jgi:hypothetical protein
VGEADAIAALLAADGRPADLVDAHIRHAIAQRVDHARRGRAHLDPGRHGRQIADRDVGALVAVAAEPAAHVVAHARPGIVVDVAQHPAVGARGAVDRQGEFLEWLGRGRYGERQREQQSG